MQTRRRFLAASVFGVATGALLEACAAPPAPVAPTAGPTAPPARTATLAPAPTPTSPAAPAAAPKPTAAASSGAYPTYVPVKGGPKPDYHDDNPIFSDGFENYPAAPVKANDAAPGTGSTINILVAAYFPVPTPYDQNPTWQAVNKQLNADVRMNIIPGDDYRTRFATTMTSDDLPDIMHIYFGYSVAPNLPDFFKSKCADLTPYLAGDAAKEYPYLAAIPPTAWKNSISAIDGQLFLVPIHRPQPSAPEVYPFGGNMFVNTDIYESEIGAGYVPKDAADFKRVLQQLNRPQENRWAIGKTGTASTVFGLGAFAQMFGAPAQWKLENGKLIRSLETEEYKAAVAYLRDLITSGVFYPDSATSGNTTTDFVARRFAIHVDSQGNSWADMLQRGLKLDPPVRVSMLPPFAAIAGQKPIYYLGRGALSMNVLRKASPERIKELLRVMNWLASPFGSQEDLLLTYGREGQDYTKNERGNPIPSVEGTSRSGYVPWRYISQHPWVYYQADLPGFAKASYDAEHASLPLGIDDPTNGYFSPTFYGRGQVAENAFFDSVREIVAGHSSMSDYDGLVKAWNATAGDQIKQEYLKAMGQ